MKLHIDYKTVTPYPLERKNFVIDLAAGGNMIRLAKEGLKPIKKKAA